MRKIIQKVLNILARKSIEKEFPEAVQDVRDYAKKSGTTGTQWITLWLCIRKIKKHQPAWILESGTGSSTLVLAAVVAHLRKKYPNYDGRIISMESMEEWYELALKNLPEKYKNIVEIVYGPREKYEISMFRGYIHSNIPKKDYSFILIDGPAFQDAHGISFCADLFKIMEFTDSKVIHGVSDGRASTVWVIQQIYGHKVARYWHSVFAASFSLPKINATEATLNTPKHFKTMPNGSLDFIKFRKK